jgi:hypothetical protein
VQWLKVKALSSSPSSAKKKKKKKNRKGNYDWRMDGRRKSGIWKISVDLTCAGDVLNRQVVEPDSRSSSSTSTHKPHA